MNTLRRGPQVAIPGFLIVCGFFFLLSVPIQLIYGERLPNWQELEKYTIFLPYISIAVFVASYLVGALANTFAAGLYDWSPERLKQIWMRLSGLTRVNRRSGDDAENAVLLEYASPNLNQEISVRFGHLLFVRMLVIALAMFTFCFVLWCVFLSKWTIPTVTTIVASYICYRTLKRAHRLVSEGFYQFRLEALRVVQERNTITSSNPSE